MMVWNGCVKSGEESRPNAATMFAPSTNSIVRQRRAFGIEAIRLNLLQNEPNERFSLTDSFSLLLAKHERFKGRRSASNAQSAALIS
jgi:hypothetical protein